MSRKKETSRKILLCIVEGQSDENVIGSILNDLTNNILVRVHVTHGDLTTMNGVTTSEIKKDVGNEITTVTKSNKAPHFEKSDIEKVIMFTDTDGCFIENKFVQYSDKLKSYEKRYFLDHIEAAKPETIQKRNKQKSANLKVINSCSEISGLPFEMYYFSCNIDHALYNQNNLSSDKKKKLSRNFSVKYYQKPLEFLDFLKKENIVPEGSYLETWKFIEQENHSLERWTNFLALLKNNKKFLKDEVYQWMENNTDSFSD
jgi:hypothetical protein